MTFNKKYFGKMMLLCLIFFSSVYLLPAQTTYCDSLQLSELISKIKVNQIREILKLEPSEVNILHRNSTIANKAHENIFVKDYEIKINYYLKQFFQEKISLIDINNVLDLLNILGSKFNLENVIDEYNSVYIDTLRVKIESLRQSFKENIAISISENEISNLNKNSKFLAVDKEYDSITAVSKIKYIADSFKLRTDDLNVIWNDQEVLNRSYSISLDSVGKNKTKILLNQFVMGKINRNALLLSFNLLQIFRFKNDIYFDNNNIKTVVPWLKTPSDVEILRQNCDFLVIPTSKGNLEIIDGKNKH